MEPKRLRSRVFAVASDLRTLRLRYGLRLSEVTDRAGLTLTSGSHIERDPSAYREDAEAMREAIGALAKERGLTIPPPANEGDLITELVETLADALDVDGDRV